MVYLPTWMVDFYGKLVAKYSSPMDPMGTKPQFQCDCWDVHGT